MRTVAVPIERGQEKMEAGGECRAEEAGALFCQFVFYARAFSPFLRTGEEAEFENKGKKRKPDGVKSLC